MPPPLAIMDVRYVGDPSPWWSPRAATSPRTRARPSRSTTSRSRPVVDYMTAAADTENIVHAGWGLESNAMAAVPFTPLSADLDEVFAGAEHVVECEVEQNRYVAMPMETRGIMVSYEPGRQELEIVCATQSVHETRNFFAALPPDPRRQRARHRARRRRRVRPEDVRVPRGVRGRARVRAARPAGEVDRGPPREPALGRALPERGRARAHGHRRRRRDPGHHRRRPGRRRRLRGVPGGHRPDARARPLQDPPLRLLDGDGLDQHHGEGGVPRPVDVRDDGARGGDGLRGQRDRPRPGRVPAPQPAGGLRSALHVAERQRVPGDHPARDARAGARDPRLRRVPQGAGRRARRGPLPRRRLLRLRRADVDGRATPSPPRPPR